MNIFTTQEVHLCPRSKIFFKIDEFCCYKTSYKTTHPVCIPLSLTSLLSIMSAKFIHVIVCNSRFWFSFSFQVVFHCIDVQNLLIYSPVDEHWFVSKLRLLRIKLLWTFLYKHFCGHASILLANYLGTELTAHRQVCV